MSEQQIKETEVYIYYVKEKLLLEIYNKSSTT